METVTVSTENIEVPNPPGIIPLLHKKLTCTCGWEREEIVYRSEQAAKHHLLFKHGKGWMVYEGTREIVPWDLEWNEELDSSGI